jgi:hypothetical protein
MAIKKFLFKFFLATLAIFQIQDGLCTHVGVDRFGIGIEANPLIRCFVDAFGVHAGLALPKLFGLVLIAYILYYEKFSHKTSTLVLLFLVNCFYLYAAINWFIILTERNLI